MKKLVRLLLLSVLLASSTWAAEPVAYPVARRGNTVEVYHGIKVPDPYRWLELIDSAETREWVAAEDRLTEAFLKTLRKRALIRETVAGVWNYERFSPPVRAGKWFYYSRNSGLQNQSVWMRAPDSRAEGAVFFDPNEGDLGRAKQGSMTLGDVQWSPNGKYWLYGLHRNGADRSEWRVRETTTLKDEKDGLPDARYEHVEWSVDSAGFYYVKMRDEVEGAGLKGAAALDSKVYYHLLGTPAAVDSVIYERPGETNLDFGVSASEDGKWLVVTVAEGSSHQDEVWIRSTQKGSKFSPLISKREFLYSYLGNDGDTFYFHTDDHAPLGKVVKINLKTRERMTLLPESTYPLRGVQMVGNSFVALYLEDVKAVIKVFDLNGVFLRNLPLPGIGTVGRFVAKRFDGELYFSFSGLNIPPSILRYEAAGGSVETIRKSTVEIDSQIVTSQATYRSKDGTSIPISILSRKGIPMDGSQPTLLYAYGGFHIPVLPVYSPARLAWVKLGGVFAIAHIRGGAEYGEKWWQGGALQNKKNCFDDFIAAAEWLIRQKYTRPEKLAITGRSNGGLLVGATLNLRPDLFAAADPQVGVMDMLRFEEFTVGAAWKSDYGDKKKEADFKLLLDYSPYHNALQIKPGTRFPAVLVTTGDHDDRVFPAHSFKYTAALQAAALQGGPVFLRVEKQSGHGQGKTTDQSIDEVSDSYAFLLNYLQTAP